MANHKQALKRHRQSLDARARNRAVKSHVKNAIKTVRSAIESNDRNLAETELRKATSVLDKASSKGVLHWRNASRRISRLSKAVKQLEA